MGSNNYNNDNNRSVTKEQWDMMEAAIRKTNKKQKTKGE